MNKRSPKDSGNTIWKDGHFIGGDDALDFANTLFHPKSPVANNDLINTKFDIFSWCEHKKIIDESDITNFRNNIDDDFVGTIKDIRNNAITIFDAIIDSKPLPVKSVGKLMCYAGTGMTTTNIVFNDTRKLKLHYGERNPYSIFSILSYLILNSAMTLPRDRIKSCPKCSWFFLDATKSKRRIWCSMQTCGNREKARRYRELHVAL